MNPVTLLTLDYPPDTGGVARYLSALVQESGGDLAVQRLAMSHIPFGWLAWVPMCLRARERSRAILVSHVLPVGTAAWLARMCGGVPYHVIVHGLDIRLASRSWWKRWVTRHTLRRANTVFVNSLFTKGLLREVCPDIDPVMLTPGVENVEIPSRTVARAQLGIGPDDRVILSVGRLVPRKGHDLLINAYMRMQTSARLVIIGQGPQERALRAQASAYGDRITIHTDTTDQERWAWYAAADVFALTLRQDPDDPEGFGIVFLEAGLAGLPVVTGRNGGASEAVIEGQTGFIVNSERSEDVAHTLDELLTNTALAERLGEAGRVHTLRDYSWHERWLTLSTHL